MIIRARDGFIHTPHAARHQRPSPPTRTPPPRSPPRRACPPARVLAVTSGSHTFLPRIACLPHPLLNAAPRSVFFCDKRQHTCCRGWAVRQRTGTAHILLHPLLNAARFVLLSGQMSTHASVVGLGLSVNGNRRRTFLWDRFWVCRASRWRPRRSASSTG